MITPNPNPNELPVRSTERGATFVREDLGGGIFRQILSLRPVSFFRDGAYREIVNDYIDSGDINRPYVVGDSPLMVSVGAGGTRRLHPTRELGVYLEIGRPYNVATRTPYTLNPLTRSGNLLTSTNTLADVMIWHGGHFSKLGIELKGSWRTSPPAQFAFPVTLSGLTWNSGTLFKDGVPVMNLTAPMMYDAANPTIRRAITWSFENLAGQMYVVFNTPSTAGMSRPLIDPTLTLQPDGTAGKDARINSSSAVNVDDAFLTVGEAFGGQIHRSWIWFDLSSLSSSALISSAVFSLYANLDFSTNARTFRIYRSKRAIVETQVTWNEYSTGNSWQTAGGFGVNDCEQTDIGSRAFTATETLNQFKDFVLTPTTKAGLDLGNGWLLKFDTESNDLYGFASSDDTTAANRPKLVVVSIEPSSGRGVFTIPFAASFQGAFGT